MGNFHNITEIEGNPDDPRLEDNALNAVLIANTYHELIHALAILDKIQHSLRAGGRLVVVDRGPKRSASLSPEIEAQHHELDIPFVEAEIVQSGFDVVSTEERFIEPPRDDPW